jgi:hypothetical protein
MCKKAHAEWMKTCERLCNERTGHVMLEASFIDVCESGESETIRK